MTYSQRREILESLIQPIPGAALLSERVPIVLRPTQNGEQASRTLEKIFRDIIGNCKEGIVLKADESRYHDFKMPWVKLKKDYIPGYGDTLDFAAVGAGWDKARARELKGCNVLFLFLYL
jgi:DNA ligase-4